MRRLLRTVTLIVLPLTIASVAYAQRFGWSRVKPRFPIVGSFDGSFNFCRVLYRSDRWEAGGTGWSTDYPDADINFSIRLSELTKAQVSMDESGQPNHLVVRLNEDELFRCPFITMEDVGTLALREDEIVRLRAYLLKGGFLWVDDFWGTQAWEQWVHEIGRVLPPNRYPITALPLDHEIYRTLFQVKKLPQIPAIQFWRQSRGNTSERGDDSPFADFQGISDEHGRLMVLMTHNTDISDAWEREGEDREFFYSFSPDGYAVGINTLLYAMTH